MKSFYLTDNKTWVDCWTGKRWEPVSEKQTIELLKAIKEHRIPIHWRSERVAEFVTEKPDDQLSCQEWQERRCKPCGGHLTGCSYCPSA